MEPILFADTAAFEAWLTTYHADTSEVWILVGKKGSGVESLAVEEALDVALCFGWIDGQRKGFDDRHFLQRYVPRRPRSTTRTSGSTPRRSSSARWQSGRSAPTHNACPCAPSMPPAPAPTI